MDFLRRNPLTHNTKNEIHKCVNSIIMLLHTEPQELGEKLFAPVSREFTMPILTYRAATRNWRAGFAVFRGKSGTLLRREEDISQRILFLAKINYRSIEFASAEEEGHRLYGIRSCQRPSPRARCRGFPTPCEGCSSQ